MNVRSIQFVRDVSVVSSIAVGCFVLGMVFNSLRTNSIPWIYQSPNERLLQGWSGIQGTQLPQEIELEDAYASHQTRDAQFVDARENALFLLGRIPGAFNFPKSKLQAEIEMKNFRSKFPFDQKLIIYCSEFDCGDSDLVGRVLLSAGFQDVKVFKGGWREWTAADFPIEK